MSDFDPYYKWLGIPLEEQPPTHYRLLGIQLLEQNAEVIEAAANRQMTYLQELSAGDEHIDEAQRLLGEVARARVCLLAEESKARYDAQISSKLEAGANTTKEDDAQVAFGSGNIQSVSSRRSRTTSSSRRKTSSVRGATRATSETSGKKSSSMQVKIVAAAVPAA